MDITYPAIIGSLLTALGALIWKLYNAPRERDLRDRDIHIAQLEGELHSLREQNGRLQRRDSHE